MRDNSECEGNHLEDLSILLLERFILAILDHRLHTRNYRIDPGRLSAIIL
jgi:hypothetical protein